jgi:hypothetical protein
MAVALLRQALLPFTCRSPTPLPPPACPAFLQSAGQFYRSRLAVVRSELFNQESLRKALGACARNRA